MIASVSHPDNNGYDKDHCCCHSITALAYAAEAIHRQHCQCLKECDQDGCDCCTKSLALVLDAMDAHLACMRSFCQQMAVKKAVATP